MAKKEKSPFTKKDLDHTPSREGFTKIRENLDGWKGRIAENKRRCIDIKTRTPSGEGTSDRAGTGSDWAAIGVER